MCVVSAVFYQQNNVNYHQLQLLSSAATSERAILTDLLVPIRVSATNLLPYQSLLIVNQHILQSFSGGYSAFFACRIVLFFGLLQRWSSYNVPPVASRFFTATRSGLFSSHRWISMPLPALWDQPRQPRCAECAQCFNSFSRTGIRTFFALTAAGMPSAGTEIVTAGEMSEGKKSKRGNSTNHSTRKWEFVHSFLPRATLDEKFRGPGPVVTLFIIYPFGIKYKRLTPVDHQSN